MSDKKKLEDISMVQLKNILEKHNIQVPSEFRYVCICYKDETNMPVILKDTMGRAETLNWFSGFLHSIANSISFESNYFMSCESALKQSESALYGLSNIDPLLIKRLKIPTKNLNLTSRIINCMLAMGLHWVGDIVNYHRPFEHPRKSIKRLPNFGPKSYKELKVELNKYGLDISKSYTEEWNIIKRTIPNYSEISSEEIRNLSFDEMNKLIVR